MTGPKPQGPTHPTPTGPPKDDVFALAASLGEDVAIDSGRGAAGELSSRPVRMTPARPFSTVGRGAQGGPVYSGRGGKGAVERASRPVEPDSEGGRAGDPPVSGAVSDSSRAGAGEPLPVLAVAAGGRSGGVEAAPGPGFSLPVPVGPPRFEVPSRPGTPGLPPPQPSPQPGPTPHPPPPLGDLMPDRDWCDVGWLP